MANGVLGYRDRVAGGTVTVSTEVPTLPGTNLQHVHLSKAWQSTANSATINVDFGASYTIGAVWLGGTNGTATATRRIRISANSDMSSPTHDSGSGAAGIDPDFGALVHVLSTPSAGRYMRVELSDAALSYWRAGRLWAGTKIQTTRNFQFGYTKTYVDTSIMARTDAGQIWTDTGVVIREFRVRLPALTDAEINGDIDALLRLGRSQDILFVMDPGSSNLGRDSIFGVILENLSQQHSNPNIHQLDLVIAERN